MRTGFQLIVALLFALPAIAQDMVLVGGTIIDGTGRARVRGNVRIRGGEVADIGTFQPARGEVTLNVAGLIVAPGFIDLHNHSADALAENPGAVSQITQGVTTVVLGPDGGGPIGIENFMARFDENPAAVNLMTFVGHANVRVRVMGANYRRAATGEELSRMEQLVEDAMREGAFGLSSALEYDPGSYATVEEMVVLAKVAARYGGIYMTHIRNEGDGVLAAIAEAIEVGRQANIPVQISHLKLGSAAVWGKAAEAVALIDKARAAGVNVAADVYPYNTAMSSLRALVPAQSLGDSQAVSKALENAGGAGSIWITQSSSHPDYKLKTLEQIAQERGITPADLYGELVKEGETTVISSSIAERDIAALLRHAWVMVASDGGIGMEHPRASGTFARVLGKNVRDDKLFTLEVAVRKITGLPASRLGLKERGVLAKGSAADIVVFDPNQIRDASTLQDPAALSQGIRHVFVNGVMVLKEGQPTEARPGNALR
jgi:N-acyl-D-aspartate/D-glutamate deacylase